MERYGNHRPTAFDPAGAFLPDQAEWFVAPVSQTRDSGPLDQSNFAAALSALGGESDTAQVHRFGHWGPGWYEIILIDPADPVAVAAGEEIERALSDYPVLDESDFCEREYTEAVESWLAWGFREFVDAVAMAAGADDTTADYVASEWDRDNAFSLYMELAPEPYCGESSGVYFPSIKSAADQVGRDNLARLVRRLRAGNPAPYKGRTANV